VVRTQRWGLAGWGSALRSTWGSASEFDRVVRIALVVGLLLIVLAFLGTNGTDRVPLWTEVGKTGLQVAVVVLLGAVVNTTLKHQEELRADGRKRQEELRANHRKDLEALRDDRRRLNDYRQSILLELRTAYEDLKRVRRELRVDGFTDRDGRDPGCLDGDRRGVYHAHMRKVSDAQLALEEVVTKLGTLPDGEKLGWSVQSMAKYVDELVGEWEESDKVDEVRTFGWLMGFTGEPQRVGNNQTDATVPPREFVPGVTKHYKVVVGALQSDILKKSLDVVAPSRVEAGS
jgi:hypothetical protein